MRKAVEGKSTKGRVKTRDIRDEADRDAPVYDRETAAFFADTVRDVYHLLPTNFRKARQMLKAALDNANVLLDEE